MSQLYLAGWFDPHQKQNVLYSLKIGPKASWQMGGTKRFGWSENLTLIKNLDGTFGDDLERVLAKIESKCAHVNSPFKKLRDNNKFPQTIEDRAILLHFLTFRKLFFPPSLFALSKTMEERYLELKYPNRCTQKATNYFNAVLGPGEFGKGLIIRDLYLTAAKAADLFASLKWRVYFADTPHVLLPDCCSYESLDGCDMETYGQNVWWFPLSRKYILSISPKYESDEIVKDNNVVNLCNDMALSKAYLYIFSSNKDNKVDAKAKNTLPKTDLFYH